VPVEDDIVRAPYNNTFDSFFGPTNVFGGPGNPNVVNQACRLVPIDNVQLITWYDGFATADITTDTPLVTPPGDLLVSPGVAQADFYYADQVAIPSGAAPNYFVADAHQILGSDGNVYYRYTLIPLPYPF